MLCNINKFSLRLIAPVLLQTQVVASFSTAPIPPSSTMFSIQSHVADIVSRSPGVSSVFDKYHIDFCCGGAVSLQSACESKGLSPTSVLAEIQESLVNHAPRPKQGISDRLDDNDLKQHDWLHEENVNTIIDHILDTYHEPLKTEMIRLGNLMNKVVNRHGPNHPELLEMHPISTSLFEELKMHLMKEETILFPYMREIYAKWLDDSNPAPRAHCGGVTNPIRVMEEEHEHAGDALKALKSLSHQYTVPEEGCNSYKALYQGLHQLEYDLHRHIHLENYVLHPLSKKMEQEIQ